MCLLLFLSHDLKYLADKISNLNIYIYLAIWKYIPWLQIYLSLYNYIYKIYLFSINIELNITILFNIYLWIHAYSYLYMYIIHIIKYSSRSSISPQPRDWTQVSPITGGFSTSLATKKTQEHWDGCLIPSPGNLPDPGIDPGSSTLQTIL